MALVYLGLGSNLGNCRETLISCVDSLCSLGKPINLASLYITAAQDYSEQPDFWNTVIALEVLGTARDLLANTQHIEKSAGRLRGIPKGPRTLDIDILLWDDLVFNDVDLIIPHPAIAKRRFVLEPLLEISDDIHNPLDGGLYKDYLPLVYEQGIYARHRLAYNGKDIWTKPYWNHHPHQNLARATDFS